eukprot:Gb_30227 [translate_table: standard]
MCIPNGLPSDHVSAANALKFMQAVHKLGPAIIRLLRSVADEAPPITCIVSDCLFAATHEVAKTLGVPRILRMLVLYSIAAKEAKRPEKLISCLPGNIPPLSPTDLLTSFRIQDSADASFQIALYEAEMQSKADYVLVNSFEELEGPETISGLSQGYPALAVGAVFLPESLTGNGAAAPIVARTWKEDSECLKWLDTHPPGSLQELAFGLKASQQPFLWALRPDVAEGMPAVLPEGFVEGIRGRGLIVEWTPQRKADQFLNCRFAKEIWRIGMDLDSRFEDENVLVTRDQVEKVVRALMQGHGGKSLRNNGLKLKEAAVKAVMPGGSSFRNLNKFAEDMTRANCV